MALERSLGVEGVFQVRDGDGVEAFLAEEQRQRDRDNL
jgi:hypothetical protein